MDTGLGLRPDDGKRLGTGFVAAGLGFARRRSSPSGFRLSVAAFDGRAIRVYERAGFRRMGVRVHRTNGDKYFFLKTAREA